MAVRTVLVCETQVPLVRGGAELLVQQLVDELRRRGVATDKVSLPFKWYPKEEILPHAAAWRLLDSEREQRPADRPGDCDEVSDLLRAPPDGKCAGWYTSTAPRMSCAAPPYSDFGHDEIDIGLRDRLMALDEQMLAECRGLYTISRTVSARLETYNGLASTPLYHPPLLAPKLSPGPSGNYVLSVARLEKNKRIDLAVRAMAARAGGHHDDRRRRRQPSAIHRTRGRRSRRHSPCDIHGRDRRRCAGRSCIASVWRWSTSPSMKITASPRSKRFSPASR